MTRENLKNWAKQALNRHYWKSVLVALILTFTAGSSSSSGGGSGSDSGDAGFSRMSEEEIIMFLGVMAVILVIALGMWVVAMLLKAFLLNPLHVGCQAFFCDGLESTESSLGLLGYGFKNNYKNVAKTMFFKDLYLWLWSLLVWIPVAIFIGGVIVVEMLGDSVLSTVLMVIFVIVFVVGLIFAMIPSIMKSYEYLLVPYILVDNPDMDSKEVFALTKSIMTGHKWEAFVLYLSFIGWNLLSLLTCGILSIFYVQPYMSYTIAAYYKVLRRQNQPVEIVNNSYDDMWNS